MSKLSYQYMFSALWIPDNRKKSSPGITLHAFLIWLQLLSLLYLRISVTYCYQDPVYPYRFWRTSRCLSIHCLIRSAWAKRGGSACPEHQAAQSDGSAGPHKPASLVKTVLKKPILQRWFRIRWLVLWNSGVRRPE